MNIEGYSLEQPCLICVSCKPVCGCQINQPNENKTTKCFLFDEYINAKDIYKVNEYTVDFWNISLT